MNKTLQLACGYINTEYKTVLEFGVYQGKTISQLRNSLDESFKIYGFDSFVGLPEDWNGTLHKKGDMSTSGKIPNIPGVNFYKGWFDKTIPVYIDDVKDNIALLHIDCDLYSSTKYVLYSLNEYISTGTVIVFDEWYYNHDPKCNDHEKRAFDEWVNEFNRKFNLLKRIEDERQIVIIQ